MHYQGTPQAIARRYGYDDWPSYFWSKVDRSAGLFGCWLWIGKINDDGYGILRFGHRKLYAHRVAWTLTHGDIPPGMECLHRCDTPACCNAAAHLFLGSQADNIADMIAKRRDRKVRGDAHWTRQQPDRVARGEASSKAKLTADQVREIRVRYASGGTSWPRLAREYGVTTHLIGLIVHRKAWRHID